MADAPIDVEALRALLQDHDRAVAEVARLSQPDDRGSGERTARLSSLGAWEFQLAKIEERIAALSGDRKVEEARARLGQP